MLKKSESWTHLIEGTVMMFWSSPEWIIHREPTDQGTETELPQRLNFWTQALKQSIYNARCWKIIIFLTTFIYSSYVSFCFNAACDQTDRFQVYLTSVSDLEIKYVRVCLENFRLFKLDSLQLLFTFSGILVALSFFSPFFSCRNL